MAQFPDGKDESAFRSIGEVSAALGIRAHVLRYWEDQFAQLKPLKRAGGRRLYRPEDVALVRRIDRLVNREGYTLRGAKAALEDSPVEQPSTTVSRESGNQSKDLLPRLKAIRTELAAALAA